jgi:NADPH:quinone reductase-like Zn-dependent oxidoreductase
MQALTYVAYGPVENLSVSEVSAPVPRRHELIVDVNRAALNPKDALFRKGKFSALSGRSFPKRCGLDFAGVVRESRSPHFVCGQRVFGALDEWRFRRGTLAEQVCVSDQESAPLPDGVSDDDAAAIGLVGLTALQTLRDIARLEPAARVWIHGASGGVGTAAVQLARKLGAIVTTTSSASNRGLCLALGAHRALDYAQTPVAELQASIDVVFDVHGNLRINDVSSVFPGTGRFITTIPSARHALLELVTRWSRIQRRLIVVRPRRSDLVQLGAWLSDGTLRAVIDSRFPLARAHDAFRLLESKRARGKILVEIP